MTNLYQVIRPFIKPGDVFAFGGGGFISGAIKLLTRSAVSHVATAYKERCVTETGEHEVMIIESTTLSGKKGVQVNPASERIAEYGGSVWWLPLSDDTRQRTRWDRFVTFLRLYETNQIPYDYRQCLRMAWAPLTHVPGLGFLRNHEDLSKVYCSELVAAALEFSDGLPPGYNCSDVSPQDLCELGLYRDCVQLTGKPQTIRRFNTRPLEWVKGAAV
jgi:hypothetical protein